MGVLDAIKASRAEWVPGVGRSWRVRQLDPATAMRSGHFRRLMAQVLGPEHQRSAPSEQDEVNAMTDAQNIALACVVAVRLAGDDGEGHPVQLVRDVADEDGDSDTLWLGTLTNPEVWAVSMAALGMAYRGLRSVKDFPSGGSADLRDVGRDSEAVRTDAA